jgi:uncharacterized protein
MIRYFINREEELELLEKEWQSTGARLIILYGRRRIGKTRLLLEFINSKPGIFFFAEDNVPSIQRAELKKIIAEYFNDQLLGSLTIDSWDQLLSYLANKISNEKMYLWIDEFSYLVKNDNSILSNLQKHWDLSFSRSNLIIILSGSLLSLMSDMVLSSASPLYGRRSRDLLIQPLKLSEARHFTKYSFEQQLQLHLIIGGIPEYLQKASEYENIEDFLNIEFFNQFGYMYREPYFIISQEFKEIKTYFSIIQAISMGKTQPNLIATYIGIPARSIYPYLENLIRLGYISREEPILGKPRKSYYFIEDVLFDFWFNWVQPNRALIEQKKFQFDEVVVSSYFGKRFEHFVRQEVISKLSGQMIKSGRWWSKHEEIDVISYNSETSEITFFECKWKNLKFKEAYSLLMQLQEKSKFIKWREGKCKEKFGIIAKKVDKKTDLQEQGFLIFDLSDISQLLS